MTNMMKSKEQDYNCCIKFTLDQKVELESIAKDYGLSITQIIKVITLKKLKEYKEAPNQFI
jgi:hypothetical protein